MKKKNRGSIGGKIFSITKKAILEGLAKPKASVGKWTGHKGKNCVGRFGFMHFC